MAAMHAAMPYGLACGKKAGIGSAGSNRQSDPLRTFWAVALVGSFIAIDIHARVNVATSELDAHEAPAGRWCFATAFVAFGGVIR
jgi:hypothetical protein